MNKAPAFQLPHCLTREDWTLDQFNGKAIMLTFWTSWCPDSRVDLAYKQRLYQAMNQSKLQMLMINVTGRERISDVAAFVKQQEYSFPVLEDQGRTVYDLYNCKGVPTTILLNTQHEIVAQFGEQASFQEITAGLVPLLN